MRKLFLVAIFAIVFGARMMNAHSLPIHQIHDLRDGFDLIVESGFIKTGDTEFSPPAGALPGETWGIFKIGTVEDKDGVELWSSTETHNEDLYIFLYGMYERPVHPPPADPQFDFLPLSDGKWEMYLSTDDDSPYPGPADQGEFDWGGDGTSGRSAFDQYDTITDIDADLFLHGLLRDPHIIYDVLDGSGGMEAKPTITGGTATPEWGLDLNGQLFSTGEFKFADEFYEGGIAPPDGWTRRLTTGGMKFENDGSSQIPIPEPTTVALLGIGLAGLAGAEVRRRRKKKAVDNS